MTDAFANEDRTGPAVYSLVQSDRPGRYKLGARFSYVDPKRADFDFVVPRDLKIFVTDLASIPQLLTWLVPKDGSHTPAAYLHDALVKKVEPPAYEWRNAGKKLKDRFEADIVFRNAMRTLGVPFLRSWMMWAAVSLTTLLKSGGRLRWWVVICITCLIFGLGGVVQVVDLFDFSVRTLWQWELPWMADRSWWLEFRNSLGVDVLAVGLSLLLWWPRWQVALVIAPCLLVFGLPLLLCGTAYVVYLGFEWLLLAVLGSRAKSTSSNLAPMSPPVAKRS